MSFQGSISWRQFPSWPSFQAGCISFLSLILSSTKLFQRYFYALAMEGANTKQENFSSLLLKTHTENNLGREDIACLTANLIGGGVDTTTSSTLSFVLAMCVLPEAQKRAQEELDRVVGGW